MRRRQTLEIAVLLLFLGSLAMPALVVLDVPLIEFGARTKDPGEKFMWGIHCLALGFFVWPGWLANPLLLIATVLHACRLQAAAIFVMVLAVGSAVLAPFLLNEVKDVHFVHVHVGYVAWLASMIGMLTVTIRGRVPIRVAHATLE